MCERGVVRPSRCAIRVFAALAILVGVGGCVERRIDWLPDSSGFVYTDKGGSRVVHYDLVRKAKRVIAQEAKANCARPAVSPDGKAVAVAREEWVSVTGSRDVTVKTQIVIYDFEGQELRRSKVTERTVRLEEASATTMTDTQGSEVVWAGHADKILTPWAIYDRVKDKWVPLAAVPIAMHFPACVPTRKGFLALGEAGESGGMRKYPVSWVDWDGWESEFKEPFKLPDEFNQSSASGAWDGDAWRLTTSVGVYSFDTTTLKHEFKKQLDKGWETAGKPDWFHRFPGSDVHLCKFSKKVDDARIGWGITSWLELRVPGMQRRKVVFREGEYHQLNAFPSPDGKRLVIWCFHPGEKNVLDPKTREFVPRIPPLPARERIFVFDDTGELTTTIFPE